QEGEELEVTLHVAIVASQPELVELVRRSALGVEPDVPGLALSELAAATGGEQGKDQTMGGLLVPPRDQLDAGGDVPPLVAAAHLELAALGVEQVPEIV